MRYPKGVPSYGKGGCCPDEWNDTPNFTGCFELDGVIKKSRNKDVPDRLEMYVIGPRNAYQQRTNYSGGAYHGYRSDD